MRRASQQLATQAGPVRRAAVYTRKSTSAGLEQEFNSLDAQRAACCGYIERQEGWALLEETYDDGGFTGANTERPAFKRLLADVEAGRIDVVVVYKVDRLSRSLLDFAQMMERFNAVGASFVSVTQNFSTADAMGRLTLNMLMSFAEFEREMIGERTRDKMAASRRRGRWTGGPVPLGYQVKEKKLIVDDLEAIQVREVFDLYLEQRSALVTAQVLNERGRTTKRHLAATGRIREPRPWAKADVLRVLRNPVYAGYMPYGDELNEGEHEAIVDRETFEAARRLLDSAGGSKGPRYRNPDYILGGLLFCANCGSALTAASTRKRGREYRYYRCIRRDKHGRQACPTKPIPAQLIEEYVAERLREALKESDLVGDLVASVEDRVRDRSSDLGIEQRRLPGEIAKLFAEGSQLVDKIGQVGEGGQRLLDERLEAVGAQLRRLERRLGEVEREIAALDAAKVEAAWIARCLGDFAEVWDVLSTENRSRLLRAVIERIDYDGVSEEVRVTLADLRADIAEGEVA